MNFLDEVVNILEELYRHGWDERNGGNLSYIVSEKEVKEFLNGNMKVLRTYTYDLDLSFLIGKYFLITGTGKYFRNVKNNPEVNLGLFKVINEHALGLLWGLKDGGGPTSESPTHLLSHIERLRIDSSHHLIIHCHPTNVIAMSHIHPLDENSWAKDLWKMQTESIVVFPEGIGVLPWMLCGGSEIGLATAKKMKEYRAVVWSIHGLFASGKDIDETFGLIETIEKAAEIYMKIHDKKIHHFISDENLKLLAEAFKVNYKKGVID